jgi:hypothetical protein
MPKSVELVDQPPFVLGPFGPAEQHGMEGWRILTQAIPCLTLNIMEISDFQWEYETT